MLRMLSCLFALALAGVPYLLGGAYAFRRLWDAGLLAPYDTWAHRVAVQRFVEDIPMKASHPSWDTLTNVENNLKVPVFGNRSLLRAEERTAPRNQYYLLEKAGVRHPKIYRKASDIAGPAMIKVQEARRKLERAFFVVSSYEDYKKKSKQKIEQGLIAKQDLEKATIEEFVPGTYFNLNYFVSPLTGETEFLGIERRLQTNLHDFVSLPARQQMEMDLQASNIEVGHTPASIRESLLEKVFEMGDKFAVAVRKEYPPGVIGPISLQSVVTTDLDFVVYDVSLRVPGNPIMATTSPYTKYYYGHTMGVGRRIAMEIKNAAAQRKLRDIVT
mgnify:CR=1 FL=1